MSKDSGYTALDKFLLVRAFNDGKMTGGEKSLLTILTSHLGDNDFCWVSLKTLCREACLTRMSVIANLNALELRGYVKKLPPGDGYNSNRYIVNLEVIHRLVEKLYPVEKLYIRGRDTRLGGYSNYTGGVEFLDPNKKLIGSEKEIKRKRRARPLVRGDKKHKQGQDQNQEPNPHYDQQLREHEERKRAEMSESGKKNMADMFAKLGMKSKFSDDVH
jgi:DNA-binding MarR family transcriptional regulator